MECTKGTNNLTFKAIYEDGGEVAIKEGILFEFNDNNITFHLGTNRKACLFSVIDALSEVITDMGLGEEFKQHILESDFLDELVDISD